MSIGVPSPMVYTLLPEALTASAARSTVSSWHSPFEASNGTRFGRPSVKRTITASFSTTRPGPSSGF